jgi:hypothetical protein
MSPEPVVQDMNALRQRVERFLRSELLVLPPFNDLLSLVGSFGPAVLFGGLIRDLALGNARSFSSDVDIVVKDMPPHVLAHFASRHAAGENSFGGFRVPMGRWLFDIWTFERTWAFSAGFVDGHSLADLLSTTFFNWDAVLFDIQKRQLIARPSYLSDLQHGCLAINLRATPNELGAVVRALRLMWQSEAKISPELAEFIHAQIVEHGLDQIVASDAKRSGRRRLTAEYVGGLAISLRQHLLDRPEEPFKLASLQRALPLEKAAG